MEPLNPLWQTLQNMRGLCAVTAEWREGMGDAFEPFSHMFQLCPRTAKLIPCPRNCGSAHKVTICPGGKILAVRRGDPNWCAILELAPEDITLWELNWPKFARAICKALGLDSKPEDLGMYRTAQIGTWSADAVPAFLTIQWDEREFRHVVASLVARQKSPFILLAPTSAHIDATSQGYLANAGAEFFSLETHLILTEHGTFQPIKSPGEIFARFRPEPADDEEMLRNAIALVKAADSQQGARKVTLYMVMRLFCFDLLSARQIARRCGCARSLAYARLGELRHVLKRDPAELRSYCTQFESVAESFSDPRAKYIHRKSALHGDQEDNR